jgi:hypothetical protein
MWHSKDQIVAAFASIIPPEQTIGPQLVFEALCL